MERIDNEQPELKKGRRKNTTQIDTFLISNIKWQKRQATLLKFFERVHLNKILIMCFMATSAIGHTHVRLNPVGIRESKEWPRYD